MKKVLCIIMSWAIMCFLTFGECAGELVPISYIGGFDSSSIDVINTVTGTRQTYLTNPYKPVGSVIDQVNGLVFSFNNGEIYQPGSITVINAVKNEVVRTINVGIKPKPGALDTVKRKLYIPLSGSNSLTILDYNSYTTKTHENIGTYPSAVALDADSNKMWIALLTDEKVKLWDLSIGAYTPLEISAPGPTDLKLTSDKRFLFILCNTGTLLKYTVATGDIKPISVGLAPTRLAFNTDETKVYITNCTVPGAITEVDVETNAASSFPVGDYPSGINVLADRMFVTFTSLNQMWQFSMPDFSFVRAFDVPATPFARGDFIFLKDVIIPRYTLEASTEGDGTIMADGLTCNGSNCSGVYDENTAVTITATSSKVPNWTGCDLVNGNVCSVVMSNNKAVQVVFSDQVLERLIAQKTGSGNGQIEGPVGLNEEGRSLTGLFPNGAKVTMTAVADTGSSFGGWTGCTTVSGTTCEVTMEYDITVTATFTMMQHAATKASFSTNKMPFGKVAKLTPKEKKLVIKNVGKEPLFLYSAEITGTGAEAFSIRTDYVFGQGIAKKGSIVVYVIANDDDYELDDATLVVSGNFTGGTKSILLEVNAMPPKIKVPAVIQFGTKDKGKVTTKTFIVQNTGLTPLGITDVTADSSEYEVVKPLSSECSNIVKGSKRCIITVNMNRNEESGLYEGAIKVFSTDPITMEAVIRAKGKVK